MRTKSILILLIASIILTAAVTVYSDKIQDGIAQNILRLHVLANSNDHEDQALKLMVRDRILKESGELFKNSRSLNETRRILNDNMEQLAAAARDEIIKAGYNYDVSIETGRFAFPAKYYENIALPAGEYDAVRVKIGNAKGENWWCVMFPPLCFVDAAMGKSDEDALDILKENLTASEYSLITSGQDGDFNIRFKVVDFFNESVENVKTAFALKK